jgi:alpha-soluble NSF attachment protein
LANKLYLKVADLSAHDENDFGKAIEIYEKVAAGSVSNNLMVWSVKEYLFKAGLCHLAMNAINEGKPSDSQAAFDRYANMGAKFKDTIEYEFLGELLSAVEAKDGDSVGVISQHYHETRGFSLDTWRTDILYKVKLSLQEQEPDFS